MAQGQGAVSRLFPASTDGSSDGDVGDEEDELDNTKLIPAYAYSTISFQKRQALGKFRPFCSLTRDYSVLDDTTQPVKL